MTDEPVSAEIEALAARDWILRVAPCPVSEWAIRAWCGAIGIDSPRHLDANWPGGITAPPPMLQSWAGAGLLPAHDGNPTIHHEVRAAFIRAGFSAVVATNYEQDFLANLRPGDVVREMVRVESVSSLKRTALGIGHFVTIAFRFSTTDGLDVGRLRVRTLYFKPNPPEPPISATSRSPDMESGKAAIQPALAALDIPLTTTLVVAGSIASNDFEAIHHDPAVARAQGLQDVILSIVTSAGLVYRYILDNINSDAKVARIELRLGTPAFPGIMLSITGQRLDEGSRSSFDIAGQVEGGVHLRAKAVVE